MFLLCLPNNPTHPQVGEVNYFFSWKPYILFTIVCLATLWKWVLQLKPDGGVPFVFFPFHWSLFKKQVPSVWHHTDMFSETGVVQEKVSDVPFSVQKSHGCVLLSSWGLTWFLNLVLRSNFPGDQTAQGWCEGLLCFLCSTAEGEVLVLKSPSRSSK